MKIKILSVAVCSVAGAVFLAGCSGSGSGTGMETGNRDQDRSQAQTEMREEAVSGVTEWIAGLSSGKAYECEYTMDGGDGAAGKTKIVMDRDRYRTEVATPQGEFVSVFDGETSYSWTAGETKGMKMSRECMESLGGEVPAGDDDTTEEESFRTPEEALTMIPDISCHEVSGVDFSVPGDVEFADQCEMLREQMRMMEQYQDQMPEDVQKMMMQGARE